MMDFCWNQTQQKFHHHWNHLKHDKNAAKTELYKILWKSEETRFYLNMCIILSYTYPMPGTSLSNQAIWHNRPFLMVCRIIPINNWFDTPSFIDWWMGISYAPRGNFCIINGSIWLFSLLALWICNWYLHSTMSRISFWLLQYHCFAEKLESDIQ